MSLNLTGLLACLVLAAIASTEQVEDFAALLHTSASVSTRGGPESELEVKVGDMVFHNGIRSKVIWDGRPDHEFLKIQLLEGMKSKQTKIVELEELSIEDPAVEKLHKHEEKVAKAVHKKERKHAPPSREAIRRRRSEDAQYRQTYQR
mmetsp:Transcript_29748/g.85170  ORF Transcript_29748/g.85170 Transcript_29748/m.85170 type:complete len:148 (+) Transcript_29748:53-496(+)